jgi:16S rRNA (guanine966-N2)-methyltransferase
VRVIAGTLRGRRLVTPPGLDTRPTPDRVREALFSILGGRIPGARFLDLFAGSGANGIEARSRGAAIVVLVESERGAGQAVRRNLTALRLQDEEGVIFLSIPWPAALAEAHRRGGPFTIVFADPPFREAPYEAVLASLEAPGLLDPAGLVVLEHEAARPLPEGMGRLKLFRTASYGRVGLGFYRRHS